MRSTTDGLLARRTVPVHRELMELFYQGSTLRYGRYFIFARTSRGGCSYFRGCVRKRATGRNGIPVHELVTRDSSYETTGILREGSDEEDRAGKKGGAARDTQRHVGIICTFCWLPGMEVASLCSRYAATPQSRALDSQTHTGLWIFPTKHSSATKLRAIQPGIVWIRLGFVDWQYEQPSIRFS